jgi:hypothetical protein
MLIITALAGALAVTSVHAQETSILDFVAKVTKPGSPDFVPVPERIATFDNDGTLWGEQPLYFQIIFAIDRIKELAPQHPEWKEKEPFKSVLAGDMKGAFAGGSHSLMEIMAAGSANMTTEQFDVVLNKWFTTAKRPKTGRLYSEMGARLWPDNRDGERDLSRFNERMRMDAQSFCAASASLTAKRTEVRAPEYSLFPPLAPVQIA